MKKSIESFKLFKLWTIYLLVFDVLFVAFLFISAQVVGHPVFQNATIAIGFPILLLSVFVAGFVIVYSIQQKKFSNIWYGIGILTESFFLLIGLLLVSISQIY